MSTPSGKYESAESPRDRLLAAKPPDSAFRNNPCPRQMESLRHDTTRKAREIERSSETNPRRTAVVAVSNPYHDALDEFRCEEVVVIKDGDCYTGWVRVWNFQDKSLILFDATGPDGDDLGQTQLRKPDVVYRIDPKYEVRPVDPEDIDPCPYSVRDFDNRDFYHYVRQVRERRSLGSYPLVWETEQGMLTLEGHKRLEAARRAGLDDVPVRVTSAFTDWEYTLRWVEDHIPSSDMTVEENGSTHSGWYSREQVREAFDLLREDWSEDRLAQLPQFEHLYEETAIDEPQPLGVADGE